MKTNRPSGGQGPVQAQASVRLTPALWPGILGGQRRAGQGSTAGTEFPSHMNGRLGVGGHRPLVGEKQPMQRLQSGHAGKPKARPGPPAEWAWGLPRRELCSRGLHTCPLSCVPDSLRRGPPPGRTSTYGRCDHAVTSVAVVLGTVCFSGPFL